MVGRLQLILVLLAGWLLAAPAFADHVDHESGTEDLFQPTGRVADIDLPAEAVKGSGRRFELPATERLQEHSWSIVVPGEGRLVAERRHQRVSPNGQSTTWLGQVRGSEGGMVSITLKDGFIDGFIDTGDRYWVLGSDGRGKYRLYELDTTKTPPPAAPIGTGAEPTTSRSQSSSTQGDGSPTIQDLLVVFSPEVTSRYGGVTATEAAITNYVAAINQAYVNSDVNIRLNVVGTQQLAQSQANNMVTTIYRLQSPSDGFYDEVHPLRNELSADMVAALTTETGYCGVAFLNHPQNSDEGAWAFSVTSAYAGYACLPLTLGHEIGHNQGLCHNREESGCSYPAYSYGYGYRVCSSFRTIMSYSCSGATRIYHFANPAILYNGLPTGIAASDDPANSSEAWRALGSSAADVAGWRQCPASAAPWEPGALVAQTVSHEQIDLEWIDGSDDEAGFDIERSGDNANWAKIASVGQSAGSGGTLTYSDQNLALDTTYWYRVRAFNCRGPSAYSSSQSATTDATPPPPPPDPEITGPAPGATLTRSSETFTWDPMGTVADAYALWFGSRVGASDLGKSGVVAGNLTSFQMAGLPTKGSPVHVRFFFKIAGVWSPGADYTYTAYTAPAPKITDPVSGATLSGDSETFTWDTMGTVAEAYALWFGSSAGTSDLGRSGVVAGNLTSYIKTGLPTNGSSVHVRFFYRVAGIWSLGADHSYTAFSDPSPPPPSGDPEITSPTASSTLAGSTETFTWDPMGISADNYAFWFGSSPGGDDLGRSGALSGGQSSYTKNGLPTDGRTIWVRFFFKVAGVWSAGTDYQNTAATNVASSK